GGPAMVVFQGTLYIAYVDQTKGLSRITFDGVSFSPSTTLMLPSAAQFTHDPALAVSNGDLYLAYNDAFIGLCVGSSSDGVSFPVAKCYFLSGLEDTPALATVGNTMQVAYTQNDELYVLPYDGANFGDAQDTTHASYGGPTLAVFDCNGYVA